MLLGMLGILRYSFLVRIILGRRALVLETRFGFQEDPSAAGIHLGFGSMHPP